MTPVEKSLFIKSLAGSLNLDLCRIAPAEPIGRAQYLRTWLDAGRAGSMTYLHRYLEQRIDPRVLLESARSVIVVALSYHQRPPALDPPEAEPRGRVAMYAWGDDYHDVLRDKLRAVVDRMRERIPETFDCKVCVDTAPIVERELAAAAGIGWIGKNTLVLNQHLGSYFFLGEIVTTLELAADEPVEDHCGSCTACLDACPTGAFPAAYEMDASRCISYLTIEHRGPIGEEFHRSIDEWVFGCDVCQEVCPFNRKAPLTIEPRFAIRTPGPAPRLDEILHWSADDYRATLRGSAMKRAKLDMLQRNAAIAKSNLNE